MITSILLNVTDIIVSLLMSPFTAMPNIVVSDSLLHAAQNVNGFLTTVGPVVPLLTLFSILAVITSVEVAIFAYKGIYWLIKKIPTIS